MLLTGQSFEKSIFYSDLSGGNVRLALKTFLESSIQMCPIINNNNNNNNNTITSHFFQSVKIGDYDIVNLYLKLGYMDIDALDIHGNSILSYIKEKRIWDIMVNKINGVVKKHGSRELISAVMGENVCLVEGLIEWGVKVKGEVLLRACRDGVGLGIIKLLVMEGGGNVNFFDEEGKSGLYFVIDIGRVDVALFLIRNGVDVDVEWGELKITPLQMACRRGLAEVVKVLVERNVDINKCGFEIGCANECLSPLFTAVFQREVDVIEELVKSKEINLNQWFG